MFRSLSFIAISLAIFCLSACATPTREFIQVPPGKVYAGKILNIAAPNSEEWHLLESSPFGMAFARKRNAPGESFAAQVVNFDSPQTESREKFETLIVRGAQSDAETERFSTKTFTHKYTEVRGYPCVQMHNISEDRKAQTGPDKTKILTLENEHLYCRHPVRKELGFAITYSHRGSSLYPGLKKEA